MDKKVFRQWLESVAVIKDRKPVRNAGQRVPEEWVTEIDENGEEIEVKVPIKMENETLGFDLVEIKKQPKACELGCGNIICGQVIEKRVYTFPARHWRTKCVTCNKYLSPEGDQFLDATSANAKFQYYIKYKV